MEKSIPAIVSVSFLTLTLSGCFGLVVVYPSECKNETPTTAAHDLFWSKSKTPKQSTKEDFLKEWGKPIKIISDSENKETWVYERRLWCGFIPAFYLPAPLLLPVCDGFDRIDFKGNEATRLHTRRALSGGVILTYGQAHKVWEPVCRYPLPSDDGIDLNGAKPAEQMPP